MNRAIGFQDEFIAWINTPADPVPIARISLAILTILSGFIATHVTHSPLAGVRVEYNGNEFHPQHP